MELTFTFHKLLNVHMEDDMAKRMALILSFIAFVLIFTAVMNYILIVISSIREPHERDGRTQMLRGER